MNASPGDRAPEQGAQPTAGQLLRAVAIALLIAGVLLVTVILPAEYGIDPLGTGGRLGLGKLASKGNGSAVVLKDSLDGGAPLDPSAAAAPGEPLPLPNPAVHQSADSAPTSQTLTLSLPPGRETEVKVVMKTHQVVLYSWHTDKGPVYFDFHGHSPDWTNKEAFVRYQEVKDGLAAANGSLVAPFDGEHGWYWVNIGDKPVRITLTVSGYFQGLRDYGVH